MFEFPPLIRSSLIVFPKFSLNPLIRSSSQSSSFFFHTNLSYFRDVIRKYIFFHFWTILFSFPFSLSFFCIIYFYFLLTLLLPIPPLPLVLSPPDSSWFLHSVFNLSFSSILVYIPVLPSGLICPICSTKRNWGREKQYLFMFCSFNLSFAFLHFRLNIPLVYYFILQPISFQISLALYLFLSFPGHLFQILPRTFSFSLIHRFSLFLSFTLFPFLFLIIFSPFYLSLCSISISFYIISSLFMLPR